MSNSHIEFKTEQNDGQNKVEKNHTSDFSWSAEKISFSSNHRDESDDQNWVEDKSIDLSVS